MNLTVRTVTLGTSLELYPIVPADRDQAPASASASFETPSSSCAPLEPFPLPQEQEDLEEFPSTSSESPDTIVKVLAGEPVELNPARPRTAIIGKSPIMENRLTVRSPEISAVRLKAIEDARQMQAKVVEECNRLKKEPPPYVLEELIGKGSFGRVYKA